MNLQKAISELLNLTTLFSGKADQVQGPGGNTSVKTDDGLMVIKASGFRFEELNLNQGISAVNSKNISAYFHAVNPQDKAAEEQTMLNLTADNILHQPDGVLYPKPSMETGFHAVLGKCVVHTHSVWSNLINCAENRLQLLEALQKTMPFQIAHLPFVSPGFGLSYLVCKLIKSQMEAGKAPHDIYLLGNHGIIAHADTAEAVAHMLEETDEAIRSILGIKKQYPSTALVKVSDGIWKPDSDFISEQLQHYNCRPAFFDQVLFPDQTVFFKDQISDDQSEPKKIYIHQNKPEYRCNYREAVSIHETLTAYMFIHHTLSKLNIKPHYIVGSEIDYINNMDMEKYRKGLMGEEGKI